jgi:hypothetical protein
MAELDRGAVVTQHGSDAAVQCSCGDTVIESVCDSPGEKVKGPGMFGVCVVSGLCSSVLCVNSVPL